MDRALPVFLLALSFLPPAAIMIPVAPAEDTTGGFGMECIFSPAALFPGQAGSVGINLTNRMQYDAFVRAVGIQFDWMGSHQHFYDGCITEPLKLAPLGSGLFSPSFDVPPGVLAADHTYHVCVEYQLNRSGGLKEDTWMSDTRGGLQVVDFTLSAEPSVLVVLAGGSTGFEITVRAWNGFNDSVVLGIAGPPPGNSTYSCILPASNLSRPGSTVPILICTDHSCPDRQFPLSFEGVYRGFRRTAAVTLTVQPPPDFVLNVTPTKTGLAAGGYRSFMIKVEGHRNLTDNISLSARDLPGGCSVLFFPKALHAGETARMEVSARPDAPADPGRALQVLGRSARWQTSSSVTIRVEPNPNAPGLWLTLALVVLVAAAIAAFAALRSRRRKMPGA